MLVLLESIKNLFSSVEVIGTGVIAVVVILYKAYRKLRVIYIQVTPNGGSSLADTINDIRDSLQIAQTRTQLLWEHHNGIGYYECDPETGECTYANKALCELFGISLESFKGFGWLAAVESQAERDRIFNSWISSVQDGIPYIERYQIVNRRSSQKILVTTQAWPCREKKSKRILKMFGTVETV